MNNGEPAGRTGGGASGMRSESWRSGVTNESGQDIGASESDLGRHQSAEADGDRVERMPVQVRNTGIKASEVLRLVSEGNSYDQILKRLDGLTMGDIMAVADLARTVIDALEDEHGRIEIHHRIQFLFSGAKPVVLESLRKVHPRAYIPWSDREDNNLAEAFRAGVRIKDLAARHRRQPGAIIARLERLGFRIGSQKA